MDQNPKEKATDLSRIFGLILCPTCLVYFPSIFLKWTQGEIMLTLKCKFPTCPETTIPLKDYLQIINPFKKQTCHFHIENIARHHCLTCSCRPLCPLCLPEHQTHSIQSSSFPVCPKCKKAIIEYCLKCKKERCPTCPIGHSYSCKITTFIDERKKLNQKSELINSLLKLNNEITEDIIKQINENAEVLKQRKRDPEKMISKLQAVYNDNKEHNEILKQYFQCICYTQNTIQICPGFEYWELDTKIPFFFHCNYNKKDFLQKSIEDMYDSWVKFLQHNLIYLNRELTYECLATIKCEFGSLESFLLFNDKTLITGNRSGRLLFWDLITLRNKLYLEGHKNKVSCLSKIDDNTIASSSEDSDIKIWNIKTMKCTATFLGHKFPIWSFAYLGDGLLASGSMDNSIIIWNLNEQSKIATLEGHTKGVSSLVLLSNGLLASGAFDFSIKFWNLNTYKCESTLKGHANSVNTIIELNPETIVSSSFDKSLRLWNVNTKQCRIVLNNIQQVLSLCKVDSNTILFFGKDYIVHKWDAQTNEYAPIIKTKLTPNRYISMFSQDFILICSKNNILTVWSNKYSK